MRVKYSVCVLSAAGNAGAPIPAASTQIERTNPDDLYAVVTCQVSLLRFGLQTDSAHRLLRPCIIPSIVPRRERAGTRSSAPSASVLILCSVSFGPTSSRSATLRQGAQFALLEDAPPLPRRDPSPYCTDRDRRDCVSHWTRARSSSSKPACSFDQPDRSRRAARRGRHNNPRLSAAAARKTGAPAWTSAENLFGNPLGPVRRNGIFQKTARRRARLTCANTPTGIVRLLPLSRNVRTPVPSIPLTRARSSALVGSPILFRIRLPGV